MIYKISPIPSLPKRGNPQKSRNNQKFIDPVCFITGISEDKVETIYSLLQAGIRCIQYRKKIKNKKEIFFEALKIRELTRNFDACFIVNDYADISLASFADGLHIGQEDLSIEVYPVRGRSSLKRIGIEF